MQSGLNVNVVVEARGETDVRLAEDFCVGGPVGLAIKGCVYSRLSRPTTEATSDAAGSGDQRIARVGTNHLAIDFIIVQ